MSSPTQRSLKRLRDTGAIAGIVEKYNSFVKIRQDLFGFIDLVALDAGAGILGVQTTSASNLSARVRKVTEDPELSRIAKAWLGKGGRLEFHGWVKRGRFWRCRVVDLVLELGADGSELRDIERPDTESTAVTPSRRKNTSRRARSACTASGSAAVAPPAKPPPG